MALKKYEQIEIYIHLLFLSIAQCFYFFALDESLIIKSVYTISTFIFYLLLGSVSKKLLNVFIILSFLVTCFVFPTLRTYGHINLNYITAIFYTNPAEALSYIKVLNISIYIFLFLLAIYSFIIIRLRQKVALSKIFQVILLIILLSFSVRIYFKNDSKDKIYRYFYVAPVNKMIKIGYFYNEKLKHNQWVIKESKKPSSWKIIKKPEQLPNRNIVVVIGESLRKDFLHSYGFPIKNTPFIENSNHIQFNNYIAVASYTIESLTRTIALSKDLESYEMNNNMVSLAKQLGYKTYWVSNQGKFGKYNSPVSIIALHSQNNFFLTKYEWSTYLDKEMLPYFYKILEEDKSPKMIVLHMYGSHPALSDRTGGVYDEFIVSKDISFYNKTVKNTDEFLKKVYNALEKTNQGFDMVYFSDHGLKIKNDKKMIHADDMKDIYHVPLLYWSSEMTSSQQINATRTGKDFLHLFCEILGIKTANFKKNYQFISEEENDDKEIQIWGEIPYKALEKNPVQNFLNK